MLPTSAVGQSPFGQRLSGNDVLSQRDLGSADIGAPLVKLSNHYNPSCRNGRVRKTEVTSGFSSLHNLVQQPSTNLTLFSFPMTSKPGRASRRASNAASQDTDTHCRPGLCSSDLASPRSGSRVESRGRPRCLRDRTLCSSDRCERPFPGSRLT